MLKSKLEDIIREKDSEIFDLKEEIGKLETFVILGDERLEKQCQKTDRVLKKLQDIKKIVNCSLI